MLLVLLEVLRDGLHNGYFHPNITIGIIVLLEKCEDQLKIENKWGLTLLNCVLKILTKLYQLWLSIILKNFILEPQQALLLGRSIHNLL